jgi:hypothetical protein
MKILFLIIFFLTSLEMFAQGNLQFNRVVNLKYSVACNTSANTTVATVTVPTDKVWKIESASISALSGWFRSIDLLNLYVDSHMLVQGGGNLSTSSPTYSSCPVWLSAGTYPVIVANYTGSSYTAVSSLSIIEFNVVP